MKVLRIALALVGALLFAPDRAFAQVYPSGGDCDAGCAPIVTDIWTDSGPPGIVVWECRSTGGVSGHNGCDIPQDGSSCELTDPCVATLPMTDTDGIAREIDCRVLSPITKTLRRLSLAVAEGTPRDRIAMARSRAVVASISSAVNHSKLRSQQL